MQLFLASSIDEVISDIVYKIGVVSDLKLAFITTATEGEIGGESWVDSDRQALIDAGFKQVKDYTFTGKNADQINNDLKDFDILHLNGGNTAYLLKAIHQTGAFDVIKDLVLNQGKIYTGSSAGSMVAGSSIKELKEIDGKKYSSQDLECFKFVPFAIGPHWGSKHFKAEYQKLWTKYYTKETPFVMLPNNSYLWVRDSKITLISI